MIEQKPTGPVDRINFGFSRIAMWMPAFIVCVIFYEVVARYVFFKPTLWANEMSLWIGGAIYVTSGLYAMQQRSHIRIFVLYDLAPLWLKRVFDVLSVLCVLIFVGAVLWGGFGEAAAKYWRWETFGTAWDPPIPATNKPLILVTLCVLGLQAISNLLRDWPSIPAVRQAFDVATAVLIMVFAVWALPLIFSGEEAGSKVPTHWRIGLGIAILASVAAAIYGLVKDFNVTPEPAHEAHDPSDEFDLPEEVLTGKPPAHDAASGKRLAGNQGESI